jgi:hypothetical protein
MITRMTPRIALVTAAGVAMYVATLGLPMLDSCAGMAGAAPSPSCGGDLRECLRLSAKTDIYGARYVIAEDVARCVEAFDACIHGGAAVGGNPVPPESTSGAGGSRKGLPQHFGIEHPNGAVTDCRVSGDTVSCSEVLKRPQDNMAISDTGQISGTLSGLTMTGTWTRKIHSVLQGDTCGTDVDYSGPITYNFSLDGSLQIQSGPQQVQVTYLGSCSHMPSTSRTDDASEWTATWSPIG